MRRTMNPAIFYNTSQWCLECRRWAFRFGTLR